ncbi:MAG TPA: formate dehydrogenase accessory sulfurtransferase FdhD [Vicinamibacterales bacterium]|nr:formate dehydrogenase accessory sulfurtransferase FdhD [Vicinamibacterales bacterium]
MSEAVRACEVLRVDAGEATSARDAVAVEAPLEVRLNGEPFSVIMRTPGADRDLAAGFLFSEGVIGDRIDVVSIAVDADASSVNVTLAPSRAAALPEILRARRQVTMNSSCGMCGRVSVDSLERDVTVAAAAWTVPAAIISTLPSTLRESQRAFAETGGLHAAGLFDRDGHLERSAEDVGRHNAVDKLIGRMWLDGRLPLSDVLLCVSGRLSFELVQKALLAGVPLLAAVSAPSSMAVDLATQGGMTLVGFVRGERFNVYAHDARVALASAASLQVER